MPIGIDSLVGGVAQLGGALIKGIAGSKQKHEGNFMLRNLQYPTEQLPSEITQNQVAAQQQAATGLPSEQYAQAMKNIQQSQLLALQSAHNRRAGIGAIPGIQQGTNDATLNLNAKDASMLLANKQNLQNVNNQVAGWKSRLFNSNVRGKYNQDRGYALDLMGAGNTNLYAGLDQGVAGLGMIGKGLFGKNNSNSNSQIYGNLPTQAGSYLSNGLPMGNFNGQNNIYP